MAYCRINTNTINQSGRSIVMTLHLASNIHSLLPDTAMRVGEQSLEAAIRQETYGDVLEHGIVAIGMIPEQKIILVKYKIITIRNHGSNGLVGHAMVLLLHRL